MLKANEAVPQKNGLTLFVGVTFLFFCWGIGGLRAGVARGSPVGLAGEASDDVRHRNDDLMLHILDPSLSDDYKRDLIKAKLINPLVKKDGVGINFVNGEAIDNIISLDWLPRDFKFAKHKKGLGLTVFLPQTAEDIAALESNLEAFRRASSGLEMDQVEKLMLKAGMIPNSPRELKDLAIDTSKFWNRFIGGRCPAIDLCKRVGTWAGNQVSNPSRNWKQEYDLGAFAGLQNGMQEIFEETATQEAINNDFNICKKVPKFELFVNILEATGQAPASSAWPPCLQQLANAPLDAGPMNNNNEGTNRDRDRDRNRDRDRDRDPSRNRRSRQNDQQHDCQPRQNFKKRISRKA